MAVEFSKENGITGRDGAGDADSGMRVEFAWPSGNYFTFGRALFGLNVLGRGAGVVE